jgi:hypothetical protein
MSWHGTCIYKPETIGNDRFLTQEAAPDRSSP